MSIAKVKCISTGEEGWFTVGKEYVCVERTHDGYFKVEDNDGDPLHVSVYGLTLALDADTMFELVEDSQDSVSTPRS